ncbi:helix-turn-helix transcriptional regulator [Solwaraspora sp. WMMD792]|uniref:helix-turn-helix domain-containing protein n=1 Tax=Solwaraspora sp. WMMD792 TaxID=3016099 RepID=UPI002416B3FF|nr:helix-turn-helix transcriptional regulator [Solwaraspora sp. WMMD792]MDG4774037.1 helix-turn-helix transcriptional regulator [Solwaraspora sp. WMMD792]
MDIDPTRREGVQVTTRRHRFIQHRKAVGFTQEGLAAHLYIDRTTVARWERGETDPHPAVRARLAEALDLPVDQLEALLSDEPMIVALDSTESGGTVASEDTDGGDLVNRRAFTINTALASLGIATPLRDWITSPQVPQHLGMEHIQQVSETILAFRRADAAVGGDSLCDVAIAMHRRLTRWEREASYSRQVGEALQDCLGDLEVQTGWLALDAERRQESRHYLHEAFVRARLRDDPRLEVRALQQLSMLVRDANPTEALRFAEAAQRIAAPWATPRLLTLLHLRAALAHANAEEESGFGRELVKAKIQFDKGTTEDDQRYLGFVDYREVSAIEGMGHLALKRPDRAGAMFARGLDSPDPTYQRNMIFTKVDLARATAHQGDYSGSAKFGLDVVPAVASLKSRRTRKRLGVLRADLARAAPHVPAARDFIEAYDAAKVA